MRKPPSLLAILGALLVAAPLSGCVHDATVPPRAVLPADVGHDPAQVHVADTRLLNITIPSWDGETELALVVRSPVAAGTLSDGKPVPWPVVVFLHGWGGSKESFTGRREGIPGTERVPGTDRLREYAEAGFIAVAYDARGFGGSGGFADVAGQASQYDLRTVLDWVLANFDTNGRVGLLGQSYGGGQALLGWANDARVTTAVPMYGWTDLADALIPNNVPKLEWAQILYTYGLVGSQARYDPVIHDWYRQLYTRDDLDAVRAQMDERSSGGKLAATQKPLFLCQGLQESLFPQAHDTWAEAGGFTRALLFTGGHGTSDPTCWSRAMDWFHFFLAGHDTRVDEWPAVETADAAGTGAMHPYAQAPAVAPTRHYLSAPDLALAQSGETLFTLRQAPALPGPDLAVLWDAAEKPKPFLPDALSSDPAAVTFTTTPFASAQTLLGAPELRLHLHSGSTPFQVAGTLARVRADGTSQVLGHAAFAALDDGDLDEGSLTMRFEWTHARLEPGERLRLKLAGNDPTWWMPLAADYEVTFDGTSGLDLPLA